MVEMLPNCIYTHGYSDPSVCTDENGKVIYKWNEDKAGLGNKKILKELRKKHKVPEPALPDLPNGKQRMFNDRSK